MHENDEELFQLVDKSTGPEWDDWSETTIILEHEPTTTDRQISHLTEDSNKTSTRPLIDRPLSVDEFRRLLREGIDVTDTDFFKKPISGGCEVDRDKSWIFTERPVFVVGLLVVTSFCVIAWYRARK